jgi:hypothetical protein
MKAILKGGTVDIAIRNLEREFRRALGGASKSGNHND